MESKPLVADVSLRLAQALTAGNLDRTMSSITAAAVELLADVQHASITVRNADGRLETVAPTAELTVDLEAAQDDLQEGPSHRALTCATFVSSPDLALDTRFARYAPIATSQGVHAQVCAPLFDTGTSRAVLNLYAAKAGALADVGDAAQVFAHQSAVALTFARHISDLERVVESRQLIGRAVDVTMERFDLDDARAFAFLARVSQDTNGKLRVIAERLLHDMLARHTHPYEHCADESDRVHVPAWA